jgi:hypothetical protein
MMNIVQYSSYSLVCVRLGPRHDGVGATARHSVVANTNNPLVRAHNAGTHLGKTTCRDIRIRKNMTPLPLVGGGGGKRKT